MVRMGIYNNISPTGYSSLINLVDFSSVFRICQSRISVMILLISKKMHSMSKNCLIRLFFSAILSLPLILPDISAQEEGWKASAKTVEELSKSRPEFNYYEERVPSYTLPQLLLTSDGKKVTDFNTWNEVRRPEVIELFRQNVFGRVPETPYQKSFKVVNIDKNALEGAATLKLVDITICFGRENACYSFNTLHTK